MRQRTARRFEPLRNPVHPILFITGAGMGDVVNFKRVKKRAEREQSAKQAEGNRARFGRTKSERALEERRTRRADEVLDQHRIDGKDAS
jgi:hypothetical protein